MPSSCLALASSASSAFGTSEIWAQRNDRFGELAEIYQTYLLQKKQYTFGAFEMWLILLQSWCNTSAWHALSCLLCALEFYVRLDVRIIQNQCHIQIQAMVSDRSVRLDYFSQNVCFTLWASVGSLEEGSQCGVFSNLWRQGSNQGILSYWPFSKNLFVAFFSATEKQRNTRGLFSAPVSWCLGTTSAWKAAAEKNDFQAYAKSIPKSQLVDHDICPWNGSLNLAKFASSISWFWVKWLKPICGFSDSAQAVPSVHPRFLLPTLLSPPGRQKEVIEPLFSVWNHQKTQLLAWTNRVIFVGDTQKKRYGVNYFFFKR